VYASRDIIEIQAPTLDAAIMYVCLAGMASSLDAYLMWKCYRMGKEIMQQAVPRWKTLLMHGSVNAVE
jgi:hypothetical protein